VRDQGRDAQRRASAVSALLAASRTFSAAAGPEAAAKALAEQTAAAVGAKAVVLLPIHGELQPAAGAPTLEELDAAPMAAARWAWEKGEAAGFGTGTLPQTRWTFWPLEGVRSRAGVAGVEAGAMVAGSEDERLLLALLEQGAVALERAELATEAVETETLRRADRFRSALLNSISHDLRTPLSTVLGASSTLIDYGKGMSAAVRDDLLLSIREEAERLNRYVGNLLDMTRLEGGALRLRTDWTDVRDVLGAAADRVSRRLETRALTRDFPVELSLVRVDSSLAGAGRGQHPGKRHRLQPVGHPDRDGRLRGSLQRGDQHRGRGQGHSDRRAGAGVREVPPHGGADRPQSGRGPGPVDLQGLHRRHGRPHRRRQPDPRRQGHADPDQPAQGGRDSASSAMSLMMSAVRQRILIIDDEPQIHRFLGPAMDAAGYEPLRADSGQEGLRGIALWSPDAVVLDLGLPDMDGKDVLAKARAFYDGPIVILSARDREAEKIQALDLGANDYVEKPFGVGELLARLRVALRQRGAAQGPSNPSAPGRSRSTSKSIW
jgi:CheY-like chemotaxis protein